jgi:DNA-binding NarL/FixJ family response regulator
VDPALRAEILRRYQAHARRFDRHAESRRRRGLACGGLELDGGDAPQRRAGDQVTQAELRVLELIAQGLTDKQIAERSNLSEFTVKSHVRNLFRKLPAKNRPHAVATAARRGLLTLEALAV